MFNLPSISLRNNPQNVDQEGSHRTSQAFRETLRKIVNKIIGFVQYFFLPPAFLREFSAHYFPSTHTFIASLFIEGKPLETKCKIENLIPKLLPMKIEENTAIIIEHLQRAIEVRNRASGNAQATLYHTPELSLTSYDCGDLFHIVDKSNFNNRIENAIKKLLPETLDNVSLTVGFPYYTLDGEKIILHALISNGSVVSIKGKEELANNIGRNRGVEYETRFFVPCKAGMEINLFGKIHTYEVGSRSENSIFSNSPINIAGEKVSMVICEEMFMGTDSVDSMDKELDNKLNHYLKQLFKGILPNQKITPDQYCAFKLMLEESLRSQMNAGYPLPARLQSNFDSDQIEALESEMNESFSCFKESYYVIKSDWEQQIKKDIRESNKLYHQLKIADLVIVPNGSPSATGKHATRERLLKLIGETYQEDMGENESAKRIYYNNSLGTPGGSISFDGNVIYTEVSKDTVSVRCLSSYRHGLIGDEVNQTPRWATEAGQKAITDKINGTEYYSGKQRFRIEFGDHAKNVYPKFYQETTYAYANLLKHLEAFEEEVKEGALLKRGSRKYWGNFISLSGGFDSAHTVIIRAKAIELRLRSLWKESGSFDMALAKMVDELKLNNREFDLNAFTSRFLTQQVNESGELDNQSFSYKNLAQLLPILSSSPQHLNSGIWLDETETQIHSQGSVKSKIEQIVNYLQAREVKTIGSLLDLIKDNSATVPADLIIEIITKVIVFHTVKAAYLRTDNNSIRTERAARVLAAELGVDFEVRNVDMEFKTALLLEKGIDLSSYKGKEIEILKTYDKILAIGKRSDRLDQVEELRARQKIALDGRYSGKVNISSDDIEERIRLIHASIETDIIKLEELKLELYAILHPEIEISSVEAKKEMIETFKVHNWFESISGLEIENIQARVRAAKNWEIASEYGLVPTSNPNTDEGKQGYTTYLGDLHAGVESSTADLRKIEILGEMALLMNEGMEDDTLFEGNITPIKSIYHTFTQPPSAELQQCGDDLFSQQTDEDSYGMSYFELSLVGDKLFELSDNGAHFTHISEVFERLENHPIFHGHNKWEIFSKIDKVYRQWFFATFKRRAAPWQMTNSDVSVDHHANNRTEFSGFDNAIRFERADLLLTLLHREGIIRGDLDKLRENLLINTQLQEKLQSIIWSNSEPKDIKVLIKRYADTPELLRELINERVGAIDPAIFEIKEPSLGASTGMHRTQLISEPYAAQFGIKARDLAGNLSKAKEAILDAYSKGYQLVVIPDIVGSDLGDNLRRVQQRHLDIVLQDLARFTSTSAPGTAVIVGHPSYDERTKDRSCRFYQSATVLQDGDRIQSFHANFISNNKDMPGPRYDRRTFQPFTRKQDGVTINGVKYFVAIGDSQVPDELAQQRVSVIHIGSMQPADQLEAVRRIYPPLFSLSVNASGNPSGIQVFNGRVIESLDDIRCFEEEDQHSAMSLVRDVRWLHDYLPSYGKVTISLDSPEALYSLIAMKKVVEMRSNKDCSQSDFYRHVTVVTPYFSEGKELVDSLRQAAGEILGFDLLQQDEHHPSNFYEIDTFKHIFLRNSLIGDINITAFVDIDQIDSWHEFDRLLVNGLKEKALFTEESLITLKGLLNHSAAFRTSLQQTWNRERESYFESIIPFENYFEMQVDLLIDRIRNYVPKVETEDRLRSVFAWLLSARDGGEGQIFLNNIARNELCCSQQSLFGGRLHAGAVSLGASLSLNEMKESILSTATSEKTSSLFEARMDEEIVPGLKRKEVDAIFEYMVDHNFDIRDILRCDLFEGEFNTSLIIPKIEKFVSLWEKNIWDRHAVPNGPHTKYSVDQQTSFREPLRGSWLSDQLVELKKKNQTSGEILVG